MAAVTDFVHGKIYNTWLLFSFGLGTFLAIWQSGAEVFFIILLTAAIPTVILFPLFKLGVLGAGDIKLLAVTGCFFSPKQMLLCMTISFLAGAILACMKMTVKKSFRQRLLYLFEYGKAVYRKGRWLPYESTGENSRIHFALPILIGAVIVMERTWLLS